ncbi:MAG: c-type cytochrome [Armatimonadota bacterium]
MKVVSKSSQVDDGRIFYGYYCRMCHGVQGDGNGPVGESYVPKPADLSQPAIRKLTDDELTRRMLHGRGHDPVMEQTVPLERRKPIVEYVRTLSTDGKK